ncbi:MAG: MotA/TolQ/ExbB proton channel family protein [Gemmatimonas sp.]
MIADGGASMGPLGLFIQADPVVKGVMILLLGASMASWTVILERSVRLLRVRRAATRFAASVRADASAAKPSGEIAGSVMAAGTRAWRDHDASESRGERRARIERAMRVALAQEMKKLETGLVFLATVGSTGPFVGLFGTVWGIINSFSAIAASKDTSLAVVAPGIAEALAATALGLVAAIPAVMAYNKFAAALGATAHAVNVAIAELGDSFARRRVMAQEAAE